MALVLTLFAIATLLMVAAAGLNIGSSSVQATRNFRGASRVHMVAEAGISEALQIINGPGVINLQNDVVAPWGGVYGSSNKTFSPHAGFSYYVSPVASTTNPANAGRLVAKAYGPEGEFNAVVASVIRSDVPSTAPGAIYLANDSQTDATFQGNAFAVDGNDHNYTGGYGPNPPVPGISTRNASNTQEAINSLNNAQKDNVTGLNYSSGPPIVPSISTSPAAPTATMLSTMIDDILAGPPADSRERREPDQRHGDVRDDGRAGDHLLQQRRRRRDQGQRQRQRRRHHDRRGRPHHPGIARLQGPDPGARQDERRGGHDRHRATRPVYGSLWTSDLNLNVGGSAIVYYSTQALALADQVIPSGALPAALKVTQIADCALVAAGVGGCPL
jgi:hypothetical protein